MPGIKRKASRASPYEPVSKLTKERTSTTFSTLRKESTTRAPLPLPKWPSLKRTPTKEGASPGGSGDGSPPPGLRRAPTIPLEEKGSESSSSLAGKASVVVGEVVVVPSLPKTASVVEGDDVVTTLTRLTSGASIGKTTSFTSAPAAISKELSKTTSIPKVPLIAKSISRGGSIVLDTSDVPSLSKTTSKAMSMSSKAGSEPGVALEKVVSLTKTLSKPSLTKEKSASLIVAAVEDAAEEAEAEAEAAADEEEKEDEAGVVSADIPLPPGGLMEIVFSFDTTGSMYSCLDQVRSRIQDMVQRLQADIPGIRIAIFAHGDYCDVDNYIVQWIDFGASTPEICKFVKQVARTGGGDFPEAYEVVLRRCQSVLSWTPGSQRSLVMIGDATPHEANDPQNIENIDWKTECRALAASGVRIYSVQAQNNTASNNFYKEMAKITRGRHMKMDQFSNIFDMIMAICYRERGEDFLEAYEDEVRDRYGGAALDKDLEGLFGTLRDDDDVLPPAKKTPTVTKKDTPKAKAIKKLKGVIMAKGAAKKIKGAGKTKAAAAKKTKTTSKKAGSKKKKTTKQTKKRKNDDKKKIRRENVIDMAFPLGTKKVNVDYSKLSAMKWSPWQLAMCGKKTSRDSYIKRRSKGNPGYIKVNLFKNRNNIRAVYEIGVRAADTKLKRVYAMMMKHTTGFKDSMRWDRYLLTNNLVKQEVNNVLSHGGFIYVRRADFESRTDAEFIDTMKHVNEKYSYAWNNHGPGSKPHRTIKKTHNFLMSGATCKRDEPKKTKKPSKPDASPAKKTAKKTKAAAKKTKAAAKKTKPAAKKTKPPAKKTKPAAKKKTKPTKPPKKAKAAAKGKPAKGKGKKAAK